MEESRGHCKHGDFDLREGCPQCIAEKQAEAEVNSPENIAERIEAVQPEPATETLAETLRKALPTCEQVGEVFKAVADEIKNPSPEPIQAEGETEVLSVESPGTAIVKVDPGIAPSFAKHLEAAKLIVEIAAARKILNEADAKAANDDLNVMAELRKAVDLERKSFTIPLNDHLSAINGAYKLITGPLTEADQITRRLLTAYKVEQQRKAAEAEKLNQDAVDLARRQAEASGTGEFTAEITPVPVPFAPKLTKTDQGKSGLVDNWKYRIVDPEKLPREYMVPDDAMLTSIAKKHHDNKQVAGVEFYNEPGLRVKR